MTDFAYRSQSTFLRCPPLAPGHRLGIAGLPWDGAVTHRPGARFGPRAIRSASHQLCEGTHPLFGCDLDGVLGDAGDLPLPNTSLERLRAALEPQAEALIRRHRMAWLGGDHALTLSLLRAYRRVLGRPLALVHFDAHCDTWSDHFGEPSGHGTWVHEAVSEGLVLPQACVQIGIRSAAVREARDYIAERGGRVVSARELRGLASPAQLQPLLDEIAQRRRHASASAPGEGLLPLYLSLDIDCLDPAFAPGTGTPEPGGLATDQLLSLLEGLATVDTVGMDCVEVCPPFDHAELTSLAAATLVWTWLAGQRRLIDAAQDPRA